MFEPFFVSPYPVLCYNGTKHIWKGDFYRMVHHSADMPLEERPRMRGGEGTIALRAAMIPGDYAAPVRLFSRITVPVGGSIGYHIHEQEEEFYYVLSGQGEMDDNGTPVDVYKRQTWPHSPSSISNLSTTRREEIPGRNNPMFELVYHDFIRSAR